MDTSERNETHKKTDNTGKRGFKPELSQKNTSLAGTLASKIVQKLRAKFFLGNYVAYTEMMVTQSSVLG